MDFSRADAALMASSGRATSMSFLRMETGIEGKAEGLKVKSAKRDGDGRDGGF
jgi:hypothetical protein